MSTSDQIDIFPGATWRQLLEWGYPQGVRRPTPDPARAFSVVHITGNSRLPSADGEITWRQTDPANQNSATFFVNRDGSVRQALGDPLHMDPWSNGDWNQPDLSNPRIAWFFDHRSYWNANELTLLSIENVGFEPGAPLTEAQKRSCAAIIRYFHARAGMPVNRQTVIGHYQLNSVTRPNCPAQDKDVIDEIVALAGGAQPQEEESMTIIQITAFAAPRSFTVKTGVAIPSLQAGTLEPGATQTFTEALAGTAAALVLITSDDPEAPTGRFVSIASGPFKGRYIPRDSVVLAPSMETADTTELQEKISALESKIASAAAALA